MLTAGVDTTVNGIGAAVYCLAQFPEQFERLRQNVSLARAAFDEAVRYETPVNTPCTGLRAGTWSSAAKPCPRERRSSCSTARPTATRAAGSVRTTTTSRARPRAMSASAGGIHACVGMGLARLEGDCLLTALAQRVQSIEILEQPKRRFNNVLRGLSSLKIRLKAA